MAVKGDKSQNYIEFASIPADPVYAVKLYLMLVLQN